MKGEVLAQWVSDGGGTVSVHDHRMDGVVVVSVGDGAEVVPRFVGARRAYLSDLEKLPALIHTCVGELDAVR